MESISRLASKCGICSGATVWMSNVPTNYETLKAVETLKKGGNITVAVSFVDSTQIRGILKSRLDGISFVSGTSLPSTS